MHINDTWFSRAKSIPKSMNILSNVLYNKLYEYIVIHKKILRGFIEITCKLQFIFQVEKTLGKYFLNVVVFNHSP